MRSLALAFTYALVCFTYGPVCASVVAPDDAAVSAAPVPFPYDAWSALLAKYVDDRGRVDYAALKANAADLRSFDRVFAAVAASSPKRAPSKYPTRAAREAYYLDAYNVLVWKNVLDRIPTLKNVYSVNDSFFKQTQFKIGGESFNLTDLESKVIRPEFHDPRVHMALNCASGGCPQLPREAFFPSRIDAQLDREARRFVNEKRNVDFDPAKKLVRLSHIFDWYKDDFGTTPNKVLDWINHYRDVNAQIPNDAKIEYLDYDWTLNDRALKR